MITIQNYVRARSLEEAYTLNQSRGSRIIGGMMWLKMSRSVVRTAIDLSELGLDTIEETEEHFSIGAMVTLRQLETHEGLNRYTGGALRCALQDIVGVQFRNLATVGGSIWGRFGFSDVLTFLLAVDCSAELYKGGIIPLAQFVDMPYDRDILVRLILRKTPARFAYQSMRIQRTDFPVLACAMACVDGEYRAAVGARPGRAVLLRDESGILGGGITAENAAAFADYAAKTIPTGDNLRGSAAYRTHLIRVLIRRAAAELGGMQ